MNETLVDCFDKKAKARFIELNSVMASALRDDIIKDTGHPKLRAKCLDLISKLRIEAAILNPNKTARRPESPPRAQPKLQNAKQFDDDFKEKLGLDENGQIKVSHGPEEIKEMLDKGMVKTYNSRRTANTSALQAMLDGGKTVIESSAPVTGQKATDETHRSEKTVDQSGKNIRSHAALPQSKDS